LKIRIGHGYDVHRWAKDRRLWLGGIQIPYNWGLTGHSDADVLLHAICDAILGALAMGDIGGHFPPSDPAYHGISSSILLEKTVSMAHQRGWSINNVDATILAQEPKLAPHIPLMRKKIAEVLRVDPSCISIKATTTEGLGFVGRMEGIAAHAVVLLACEDQ
jgi:2-C-methyl-D-erythritol 2,4-cyclodiphosphate synthase